MTKRSGYLYAPDECPNREHPADVFPPGEVCLLCGWRNDEA